MQKNTSSETLQVESFLQSSSFANKELWTKDHQRFLRIGMLSFPNRPIALVVLHLVVKTGIAKDILESSTSINTMQIERWIDGLVQETGIRKEWAVWAIEQWVKAFGAETKGRRRTVRILPPVIETRNKALLRKTQSKPRILKGHRKNILDICFSPDGRWLSSCGEDRSIRIWNGKNGRSIASFLGGHRDWVRCIEYHPDGFTLCSGGDDGSIRFWNLKTGKGSQRLKEHNSWVTDLEFSSDGSLLISASRDFMICMWHVETMELIGKIGPFASEIQDIALDYNGEWLAVATEQAVEVWSLEERKKKAVHRIKGRAALLAVADGELLIGDETGLIKKDPFSAEYSISFEEAAGSKKLILDPVSPSLIGALKQDVMVWDLRSGSLLWKQNIRQDIRSIHMNRQGQLALALSHRDIVLWEMERFE